MPLAPSLFGVETTSPSSDERSWSLPKGSSIRHPTTRRASSLYDEQGLSVLGTPIRPRSIERSPTRRSYLPLTSGSESEPTISEHLLSTNGQDSVLDSYKEAFRAHLQQTRRLRMDPSQPTDRDIEEISSRFAELAIEGLESARNIRGEVDLRNITSVQLRSTALTSPVSVECASQCWIPGSWPIWLHQTLTQRLEPPDWPPPVSFKTGHDKSVSPSEEHL